MPTCQIELAISPLSSQETELALSALRKTWQQPACIHRQPHNHAWLLAIRHETKLKPGDTPCEFAERIAAAIWRAVGRYVRMTFDITPTDDSAPQQLLFSETDHQRIMRSFRLSLLER